jgi:hypothetical protein
MAGFVLVRRVQAVLAGPVPADEVRLFFMVSRS